MNVTGSHQPHVRNSYIHKTTEIHVHISTPAAVFINPAVVMKAFSSLQLALSALHGTTPYEALASCRSVIPMACELGSCEAESQWCTTASGLKYYDDNLGQGDVPIASQVVTIAYTGELLSDGSKVEMFGERSPVTVVIGMMDQPIFEELIDGMKVGGRRRVVIPPSASINVVWGEGEPEDREAIRFELEMLSVEEGAGALVPLIKANFRTLASKLGVSPGRLLILLSFLPYFLPDELKPGLWKSDGGALLDSLLHGQSTGPEAQMDADLFNEPIRLLDKELYR